MPAADTTTQQLEQRLQQIAQRLAPCPIPDFSEGWDLCAHGLPWPCPSTEAAWLARGLDPAEQIRAHLGWLRSELAGADSRTAEPTRAPRGETPARPAHRHPGGMT